MRTFTESAGGHLSGYVNMSGITGKENSGWIPDSNQLLSVDPVVAYAVKCVPRESPAVVTESHLRKHFTRVHKRPKVRCFPG